MCSQIHGGFAKAEDSLIEGVQHQHRLLLLIGELPLRTQPSGLRVTRRQPYS